MDLNASYGFLHDCSEEELITFAHTELDSSPNTNSEAVDKETHLRRRLVDEKQVETISQSQPASVAYKSVKDPLKWFGLLVPPSLRTAQKNFKEGALQLTYFKKSITLLCCFLAIEISCQLASTQAKVEHYRNLYLTLIANKNS